MVQIETTEESVIAFLSGEIDHHTAKALRDEIDSTVQRLHPGELILDFRNVTFMDSSGIGLVMGRYALMQELEGTLHLTGLSGHTRRVMKLAGLDQLAVMEGGKQREGKQ